MIATYKIESLHFEADHLMIRIDGQSYSFALAAISPKLKLADEVQRNLYTISSSGYGIHWPLLDEDLSVPALLKSIQ
jgi:hypothetical protein